MHNEIFSKGYPSHSENKAVENASEANRELEGQQEGVLPVLPGIVVRFRAPDLIALAEHDKNHANRSQRGRANQDENSASQGLNHFRSGGCSLRITKRAALSGSRDRRQQEDQSHERDR